MFPSSLFDNFNSKQPQDEPEATSRDVVAECADNLRASSTALQLQHHEQRLLKAYELLIEAGKSQTVKDLIRYAEESGWQEAAEFFRGQEAESLPVDLAYAALKIHVQIVAHKRNNTLLKGCHGKRVGLIFPLPPHLADAFLSLANIALMIPDGHHLPAHLRQCQHNVCVGNRASREVVLTQEVIVLEAFCNKGTYYVDASVTDILDFRLLNESTQIILHIRSQRHPDDVLFRSEGETLDIL